MLRPRCRPVARAAAASVEAKIDQPVKRPPRLAQRIQRQWPRGRQGSSCSCCLAAAHGGEPAREQPLLQSPPSSRFLSGDQALASSERLAANSQGRPDRSCSDGGGNGHISRGCSSSGGGCHPGRDRSSRSRKGRQGLLVAGHRRHHRRASSRSFRVAEPSFLRGTLTSGARTSEGRHGQITLWQGE
jgi:hypothetical protein